MSGQNWPKRLKGGAIAGVLLLTLIAGGCAMGPDYSRPELELPDRFRAPTAGTMPAAASLAEESWRSLYPDPTLQALIEEALAAAPDLLLAEARMREAAAAAGVVRADLYPNLGLTYSTAPVPRPAGKELASNFSAGASVSWELDLWGRLRRADEASRAELLASEAGRRGVVLSLIADVAGRYYQLVAYRTAYRVAEETAANQRDALQLIRRLAGAGIATDAELRQQEVALAVTEVNLPTLRRQIAATENGLSLLLGRLPGAIPLPEAAQLALPAAIPAGLPSRLLEARPDILAAEQRLIAANARLGVAKAMYFPSLSLTGLFGKVSDQAFEVLTGGGATIASLGVNALQPLFAGKRYVFNEKGALARLDQALLSYRQTVLAALAETATALTDYQESGVALTLQGHRVASARESLRLAEDRYRAGVISFIEVLDAQRQLFAAETDQVTSLLDRRLALSRVYLALGGGWDGDGGL